MTQAVLLNEPYRWSGRGEDHDIVAVPIAELRGKLDGVRLRSANLELVSKYENFHVRVP
jgi:hypothetical protein